jgi:CheY-like chemotaxis protein
MTKILIIEDEPAYQKILNDTFSNEGFNVSLATEGKEGIIEAAKNHPDFILLDLIMPGMNGTTVLRHIHNIRGLGKIPIAVLTAVPDGVPQSQDGTELFKNIVGYWVKDQVSLPDVVLNVKRYLKI